MTEGNLAVGRLVALLTDIGAHPLDDGLVILVDEARVIVMDRGATAGPSLRVAYPARLSSAALSFHVDVAIGHPVVPAGCQVVVPRLLGGYISLVGYSPEMVVAEKLVTAIQRGNSNTRWRDFLDLHVIATSVRLRGDLAVMATMSVAQFRNVERRPLGWSLGDLGETAQPQWAAWRRRHAIEATAPEWFAGVVSDLERCFDAVLDGSAGASSWDPSSWSWEPTDVP